MEIDLWILDDYYKLQGKLYIVTAPLIMCNEMGKQNVRAEEVNCTCRRSTITCKFEFLAVLLTNACLKFLKMEVFVDVRHICTQISSHFSSINLHKEMFLKVSPEADFYNLR